MSKGIKNTHYVQYFLYNLTFTLLGSTQSDDSIGVVTGGGGGGAVGFTTCEFLPKVEGGCGARGLGEPPLLLGFGEFGPLDGLGGTAGFGRPNVPVLLTGVPTASLAGTAGLSCVAGTGG